MSAWDKMTKQEKIDTFNERIDNTVIEHGKMLNNRTDLSREEKNALQAEITENAKIAKEEFAQKMQAESEANNMKEGKEESTVENTSESNVSEGISEGSSDGIGNGSEGNGNSGGIGE